MERKKKSDTEEERLNAKKDSQRKSRLRSRYTELTNYCKIRGGKLLSEEYVSAHTLVKIRCKLDHEFEVKPYYLENKDYWCERCRKLLLKLAETDMRIELEGKNIPIACILYINMNPYNTLDVNKPETVGKGGRKKLYKTETELKEANKINCRKHYIKNKEKLKRHALDRYYEKKSLKEKV